MSGQPSYTETIKLELQLADIQSQLTQRTAELEAVKADTKNMLDVATRRLHEQVNDLQAELERVRAALEDACLSVAVHGEQPPQKWLDALQHRQGMEV